MTDAVADTAAEHAAQNAAAPPIDAAMGRLHTMFVQLRRDCPWDREQTHTSLTRHAREEAEELIEALEAIDVASATLAACEVGTAEHRDAQIALAQATDELVEELGDVLLQVFLNGVIGEESGRFSVLDVVETLEAKMVRRHPHVFERPADAPEMSEDELAAQWKRIKQSERDAKEQRRQQRLRQLS